MSLPYLLPVCVFIRWIVERKRAQRNAVCEAYAFAPLFSPNARLITMNAKSLHGR